MAEFSASLQEDKSNYDHLQIVISKNAECLDMTPPDSVQNEVVPLSGQPYFICMLSKANVEFPYQLVVPRNFYHFLPKAQVPVTLFCGDKAWEVNYYGDRSLRRFDTQWKKFSVDNNLKTGDACIFELLDDKDAVKFKVQILDGTIPRPYADGQDDLAALVLVE